MLRVKRKLLIAPFDCPDGTDILFRTALHTGVEPKDILYLTPSPRKMRQAQILFAHLYNKRAFVPPGFFTLGLFARHLHENIGTSPRLAGELKTLLVQRLLAATRFRTSTIGYARVIASFIADIKRHIPRDEWQSLPERFSQLLAGFEKPLQRLLNAYEIMVRYNAELAKNDWADDEDIVAWTSAYIRQEGLPIKVLLLDSFVAPNHLEKELLTTLINQAEITIALGFGSPDDHPAYKLAHIFNDFITAQGNFTTELLPARAQNHQPDIWRFATIEDEIAGICRHIRAHWQQIQPAATYVIFCDLPKYAPLVQRIFTRYEIPFTIYPETRLTASPVVNTVIELLRALNSEYERIATTAAFSSPFLPGLLRLSNDPDETARNRAALLLNNYSRRAGIIKGKENWWHIADSIIRDEQLEPDDPETSLLRDLQQRVRQAIGISEKILEPADTIGNQARRLKQFLETVNFARTLNPDDPVDQELLQDRKALYDILDLLVDFEAEFGACEESRNEFIKTLTFILDQQIKTPESEQPGVQVLNMEETLGITTTNIYFAGLTEEDLPGRYRSDPLLPDAVRKKLGMPDIEWHRDWQRFHFHRTLQSSINCPWLSYHQTRDGNPVLPSPFLEDLVVAPEPAPGENSVPAGIYSEMEYQLYLGRKKQTKLDELAVAVDFSGMPEIIKEINRRFGPDREVSVTALELYRRCPFQFYLKHVLNLEAPPEPAFEIAAREWGLIVHEVMGMIYKNGPVPVDQLETVAKEALSAVLEKKPLPPFWREVTRRVFENIIPYFVKSEMALRAEGFQPVKTELALRGAVADDIKVKGRIDRLDSAGNRLRIIDYKTGTATINAQAITEKRTHIQLPIYACLIKNQPDFASKQVENIGSYDLTEVKWLAGEKVPLTVLIEEALKTTRMVIDRIRAGKFPPEPGEKEHCEDCELNFTCGYRQLNKNRINDEPRPEEV